MTKSGREKEKRTEKKRTSSEVRRTSREAFDFYSDDDAPEEEIKDLFPKEDREAMQRDLLRAKEEQDVRLILKEGLEKYINKINFDAFSYSHDREGSEILNEFSKGLKFNFFFPKSRSVNRYINYELAAILLSEVNNKKQPIEIIFDSKKINAQRKSIKKIALKSYPDFEKHYIKSSIFFSSLNKIINIASKFIKSKKTEEKKLARSKRTR